MIMPNQGRSFREDSVKVSDFDYDLPSELIAQEPLVERDSSRLLVLHRSTGEIEHRRFTDLPSYLSSDDIVVLNDSRVIRARLTGKRETGGKVEVFLLRSLGEGLWDTLVRPGRKVLPGTRLTFAPFLQGEIMERTSSGGRIVRLLSQGSLDDAIERAGDVPLPPYIKKKIQDPERYQTVYAREPGSVAAPTAGLHFTPRVFADLEKRGVRRAYITLHVGLGTFRPVTVETVEDHLMHDEYFELTQDVAQAVNDSRARGGRVLAVGTTVARTLESCAEDGRVLPKTDATDLFIFPGYKFRAVDMMLTNFHLPKSTLMMLVSALAGRENIMHAYQEAVQERYRFFSFGDAMLILD
jgi:S-adenosylmethionine:tRNA ribosyltransferase-isomerase